MQNVLRTNLRAAACTVACGLMVTLTGATHAADVNAAASGDWSSAGTWTPNEPVAADNAFINGGLTVGVSQAGEVANRVDLGTVAGQTGSLNITGGDLTVGSGGALPSIRVGQIAGSTGSITMSGGTVNVIGGTDNGLAIGDILIGDLGTGTMLMTGGNFTVSDEIVVGVGPGSVGTLTVNGGTIGNGQLPGPGGRSVIAGFGANSVGTINVGGTGVINARFDVLLGLIDNGNGTLNINEGGTVNANFLFASGSATGTSTINHTGGTFNTLAGFVIGQRGQSTYNLSGGTMNGGFVSVGDDSTNATLNVTGGTINARNELLVSVFVPSTGVLNQSGGTINVGVVGASLGTVSVSRDGVLGTYNMTGGTLNTDRVFLGDFDSTLGVHNISGGTINVRGNYSVGGALASNAPADDVRTGTQGQAVDAKGRMVVRGSAASINIAGNFLANPADNTRADGPDNAATLVFEIQDATGTSLVNVLGAADLDGAVVDMNLLSFTPAAGSVFDLIAAASGFGATGIGTTQNTGTGEGCTLLAEDTGVWSLRVVGSGTAGGEILQAVYVPEPTSLLALASVSAIALGRRRSH